MFYLTPPAASAPTISLLWGGSLYLAVAAALTLSVVLGGAMTAAVAAGALPQVSVSVLANFFIIFACAVIAPTAAAATYRAVDPVGCKRHAKLWRWLAAPALWVLMFAGGASLTPRDLRRALTAAGAYSGLLPASMPAVHEMVTADSTSVQAAVVMLVNGIVARAVAIGCGWVLQHAPTRGTRRGVSASGVPPPRGRPQRAPRCSLVARRGRDRRRHGTARRLHPGHLVQPVPLRRRRGRHPRLCFGGRPVGSYMAFWALALFAVGPLLDQSLLTRAFMRAALVRAHRTEVPDEQVRALWAVLAADGGGGSRARRPAPSSLAVRFTRAGTASFTRLVRHARTLQTGDAGSDGAGNRPASPSHPRGDAEVLDSQTARELRAAVAARRRSTAGGEAEGQDAPVVSYAQFASFFKATGGMIDLNTASRGQPRGSE